MCVLVWLVLSTITPWLGLGKDIFGVWMTQTHLQMFQRLIKNSNFPSPQQREMSHFFATSIIYVSSNTFHVFLMSNEICDWQLSPVYG